MSIDLADRPVMQYAGVSKLEQLRLRLGITAKELSKASGYCRQHLLKVRRGSLPQPLTWRLRRDIFDAMKRLIEARAEAGDPEAQAVLRDGFTESDLF